MITKTLDPAVVATASKSDLPDPTLVAGPYCPLPRRPRRRVGRSAALAGVVVTLGVIAHCAPPLFV